MGAGPASPAGPVLDLAMTGYRLVLAEGQVEPGALLAIIDYSLPSTEPRLFVIDPSEGPSSSPAWSPTAGNLDRTWPKGSATNRGPR